MVYVDEEGEEIQRIIPKHNCLTLAYVDSETKLSSFLNDFFLSLTAFARVTSFFTLFIKYFLRE